MAVKTSTAMAPFLHQAQFLHLTLTRLFNIFSLQKQKKLHGKPRHSISGESVDSIGWLTSSCLFHQPLKKLEHCGISPQSRPRSHLRQVYFARYCLTFSKSCRAQKNRVDIAELLPQLSCLPNSPRNALSSSYHILATLFYSATESSVTCQTLLGLEDASKSKPPSLAGAQRRPCWLSWLTRPDWHGFLALGWSMETCGNQIKSTLFEQLGPEQRRSGYEGPLSTQSPAQHGSMAPSICQCHPHRPGCTSRCLHDWTFNTNTTLIWCPLGKNRFGPGAG